MLSDAGQRAVAGEYSSEYFWVRESIDSLRGERHDGHG